MKHLKTYENKPLVAGSKYLYVKQVCLEEILYIGDNKKDLELIAQANKYNL